MNRNLTGSMSWQFLPTHASGQGRVLIDIYLDFFSFTKFVLYKDLDPKTWPEGQSPVDHPLIKSLLAPSSNGNDGPGFSEDERA